MKSLSPDFPVPSLADWRALAEKGLKGAPFETLIGRTADGLAIQPLYAADPERAVLHARPGLSGDRDRPWDLRTLVDHPEPARANALAHDALTNGAASLLLRLDPSGDTGVAVGSQDDLARALDGVLLDLAPVALDAGFMGAEAANWLAVLAKGAPEAPLAFHLDPVSAFALEGASAGPVAAHVNAAAQAGARHAGAYPRATLFLASGRFVHEAGGTEAQELGVMAAAVVAYLRALEAAGVTPTEGLKRIVLGLSADARYPVQIAKLRAARALWARIAGACGSDAPAVIELRSSARMLADRGVHNNLLRLTAAAFAGAVGGAQAVVLDPFTAPLGGDNALARRQARNTQLILMEESHLGRVADPAGGAFFFEQMTDDLARAGWARFQAIEAEGGLAAALMSGALSDEVATAREALIAATRDGSAPILGVSLYPADEDPVAIDPRPSHAVAAPDVRQAGPDDACTPIAPIRLSDHVEAAR
ncbi:MAG: methylmalonyl-CoA mutase family protein [Brevundimonas sp.]|uniref:methylmalonyl-CoA mutase family protein n=1 Tax=Brevundimonas sp. TaxID=1871086 RepID=UPI00391C4033